MISLSIISTEIGVLFRFFLHGVEQEAKHTSSLTLREIRLFAVCWELDENINTTLTSGGGKGMSISNNPTKHTVVFSAKWTQRITSENTLSAEKQNIKIIIYDIKLHFTVAGWRGVSPVPPPMGHKANLKGPDDD